MRQIGEKEWGNKRTEEINKYAKKKKKKTQKDSEEEGRKGGKKFSFKCHIHSLHHYRH
jgi:hypothetical protein